MAKPNGFDVLKTMCERNLDIRSFPINSNLVEAKTVKKGGHIVMGVNKETVVELALNTKKLGGMLIVVDLDQYHQIEKELEDC